MVPTKGELIKVLRSLVGEAFPELKGFPFQVHGKVVKAYQPGGRGTYAVDVQLLGRDGDILEDLPVLPAVELSPIWAGPSRGIYALPPVGATVRVGFYYADPSQPYIDAVLADGFDSPAHPAGSLLIQQANGIKIEIESGGTIRIATNAGVVVLTASTVRVEGNLVATGSILANQP